ncbi:hypothetical protein AZF37_09500 [endosymbiont 'TC1' of Trimyema compressum]|uniref:tRNA pseudouridine(38-40) synthase TruA n=1 Tax=endosymbiont 'TC1' of Trimyema compressum TaxID=243899 RepID=UPI0007F090F0|nr:tRNA pseudouridine(38-40) synthase TruA [endosymbiont 'TC1' of Trimyema compressum]AMP21352.1 hypothetical protein AZF37_09500 [endosymbiont 'TC1' of Trimyema compressum]
MNIVLKVGYNGNGYNGFQRQKNTDNTIEHILEQSIMKVVEEPLTIIGASRTDSGVHAQGQMIQFRTRKKIPYEKYVPILNDLLPETIRIYESYFVPDDFHVRYQVLKKKYLYRIDINKVPNVFVLPFTYHFSQSLDIEKMTKAFKTIEGEHNFRAFCATGSSVKTHVRQIFEAVLFEDNNIITLSITGNGFLYNMIRIIAGTLVDIGRGFLKEDVFLKSFNTLRRETLGKTAPSKGLVLQEIIYEKGVLS